MAELGRVMGLGESEFWRMTPRQFYYFRKHFEESEKRRYMTGFRFLATVVAKIAGNEDVDFMEDGAAERPLLSLDMTEAYFKSLAEANGKNVAK